MDTCVFILEIIGTVAFAISGAMTAIKKKMDILGVIILGLVTAVGGGIIRDLVLGITPPTTFRDSTYAMVAVFTSIVIFFPFVRRFLSRTHKFYDTVLFLMDSLGLAIFTVMGIFAANTGAAGDYGMFLLLFVGVITGVGGGVLRDILAGNTPYIFIKHIYACASMAGAVVCAVLWTPAGSFYAMIAGAATVFLLRVLAARFKWNLPKAQDFEN
ncbi:MAG: trimeric intracellular cation channel family protein [Clostridia bacterium]|nr:trimeric intracellular cation channel family protein [Clostridia bacterium]